MGYRGLVEILGHLACTDMQTYWRGFKILNLNFFSKQKHQHMNNYPSPPRGRSGL